MSAFESNVAGPTLLLHSPVAAQRRNNLDYVGHIASNLEPFVQHYGAFAVSLVLAFESLGMPVPGETLLIFAAVLAHRGEMSLPALLIFAWAGSVFGQACKPVGPAGRPVRSSSFPRKSEWFRKKPSTALSKTTTLTCLSVSSVVMISAISRIPSGPKTLSGGWSNVTRQYAGERRDSRISLMFVADEFWFFIFSSLVILA